MIEVFLGCIVHYISVYIEFTFEEEHMLCDDITHHPDKLH